MKTARPSPIRIVASVRSSSEITCVAEWPSGRRSHAAFRLSGNAAQRRKQRRGLLRTLAARGSLTVRKAPL